MKRYLPSVLAALLASFASAQADQVQMQNGDHYFGRVLSVSSNSVLLQSEVLGNVALPREKITSITFLTNAAVKPTPAVVARPAVAATNASKNVPTQLRANPSSVKQIEDQYLAGASPEAKAKFNEMVNGLMTGNLSVSDIRVQAKTAADQLRSARRDLGEEAGEALDGYLAILDSFLRETESTTAPTAKIPAQAAKPKTAPEDEQ